MITFNFELNHKPNRLGKYTVFLRITQDRKPKRVKTGIELSNVNDWNPKKQQVRASEPKYRKYNDDLDILLREAKESYIELRSRGLATAGRIKQNISEGEKSSSFMEYARERVQQFYDAGQIRTGGSYQLLVNKLSGFLTDKHGEERDLLINDLTPSFVVKFENYLRSLSNERSGGKKLHPNTVKLLMVKLGTLVKRLIQIDHLMPPEANPFLSYECKGISTGKERLDMEEIKRIKDLNLDEGSMLWHTRNCFLFSFYCAGIRVGDCIQLRWYNITGDGRLRYRMDKNRKERDLKLVQPAKDILSLYRRSDILPTDYIFPLLDSTKPYTQPITPEEKDTMPAKLKRSLYNAISSKSQIINKHLTVLSEMAGIDKKITFHSARHSFARAAKQKGTDNAQLKDLLAHSSLKTTENYMGSFETEENDRALEHIFENTTQEKEKAEIISLLQELEVDKLKEILKSAYKNSPE